MFFLNYNTLTVSCRCFIILSSVVRFMIHLKSIFVPHVWRGRNLFIFYALFSCFNTPLAEKIFLSLLNYFAACQKSFDCNYVELFLESLLFRWSICLSYVHTTNLIMIAYSKSWRKVLWILKYYFSSSVILALSRSFTFLYKFYYSFVRNNRKSCYEIDWDCILSPIWRELISLQYLFRPSLIFLKVL